MGVLAARADPQAQLIAEAIAAFDTINQKRLSIGIDPLDEMVCIDIFIEIMPSIVMAGTASTFYKIPVAKDLVQHVAFGTYPPSVSHSVYHRFLDLVACIAREWNL